MATIHARSNRKPSGGRNRSTLSKRKHMIGRAPAMTRVGEDLRKKQVKTKGGARKTRVLETQTANLFDKKAGKHVSATIESVKENAANRNFVRRNIVTKGAIIVTDKGEARVTSRPGQDGTIEAVLL